VRSFCNNAYSHMMIHSLISRNHHTLHPSVSQSRCTAGQDGVGVWTGPVCAARAKRSLAPACAVPLASSLHCVGRSHRALLAYFQTPTTMTTYSTTNLLQLLNYYSLKYHNNQPTGYGSAVANTTFADSERKFSKEAVPPGTGTAKDFP